MNKKYLPYVVGLPNMSVGILWAMNMVLIPLLAGTVTKSNQLLGYLVSMGAFTGIFVQYLAGLLSDRSNFRMGRRKPFIIIGVVCSAAMIFLMPFAKTYAVLFLIAFLFYTSLNFFQGPYYSLIPEVVDSNKLGLANGFSKMVSVLGSGIILFAGPLLWEKGRVIPFAAAAVMGLATVFAGIFLIKEPLPKEKAPAKIKFDFIKYPAVIKLYTSVFFIFLAYGCITPFFVKYCTNRLNFTAGVASNGLLLLTIVGAAFAYPIGVLSDKIERRKVLFLGTLIFSICLGIGIFIRSIPAMYILLSFIGIGFIAIQITIYSILAEIVPKERLGEFMGFMNFFISISQFISNNVMGYVLDRFGFSYYFPISSVFMLISAVVVLLCKFTKWEDGLRVTENN